MTLAVMSLSLASLPASGAAVVGDTSTSSPSSAAVDAPRVSAPEKCSARRAVAFYSARIAEHRARVGAPKLAIHRRSRCPRYLAHVLQRKARAWRLRAERYLRDFDVRPGYSGWRLAVDEVQRVYPDTRGWLLACSASEGGWGRFVWNTQGSGCGGWLQYVPSTFVGFFARAELDARRRGFRVPRSAGSLFSPLGQALAGAWAYRNGLSHHWFGSGCN